MMEFSDDIPTIEEWQTCKNGFLIICIAFNRQVDRKKLISVGAKCGLLIDACKNKVCKSDDALLAIRTIAHCFVTYNSPNPHDTLKKCADIIRSIISFEDLKINV